MTVAELIAELQKHPPAKPVKVVLSHVPFSDESGDGNFDLNDDDALEADMVLNLGGCILIRSR